MLSLKDWTPLLAARDLCICIPEKLWLPTICLALLLIWFCIWWWRFAVEAAAVEPRATCLCCGAWPPPWAACGLLTSLDRFWTFLRDYRYVCASTCLCWRLFAA